jgi:outer membrane protein TolC
MKAKHITVSFVLISTLATGSAVSQDPDSVDFYADRPDLRSYVELALRRNPGILESWALYRSELQKIPQATALPDPMLSYTQFVRSVETRVGPQLNIVAISQRFPWFGKLDLKGRTLLKVAAARYQLFRAQEREIIHQVKQAYYQLGYVDRALTITREEQLLLEHYENLAQSRYGTGQGLRQAVIKIQAELTRILNRRQILEQQRESAVARLNTLMDRPPEQAITSVDKWDLPVARLDLNKLYELGYQNRQELRAASALIEKDEQAIELAKKDFWPDFNLSAGFVNLGNRNDPGGILLPPPDNGKDAYSFSVGVNIPIWKNKYRAGVAEATETLIADKKKYLNLQNAMEFSIRDQVVRLQTFKEQIDLFEQALIPQAQEALRSSEAAYETGQVGALDLLDSERVLLEVRLMNIRYRTDYLIALSSLERAIGTRFPR